LSGGGEIEIIIRDSLGRKIEKWKIPLSDKAQISRTLKTLDLKYNFELDKSNKFDWFNNSYF